MQSTQDITLPRHCALSRLLEQIEESAACDEAHRQLLKYAGINSVPTLLGSYALL